MIQGFTNTLKENLDTIDESLLKISDEEWYQQKAEFCISLYKAGENYEPWSENRANLWFKSLRYFVDAFIEPEFPVPHFHEDWYYWSVFYRAYVNLSPRDHAKTTVHSIIRVVWEICCNRNVTFFILFSTTDVSKLILSVIKSHLSQNPKIKAGFGIFNPLELEQEERKVSLDWSQNSITVQRTDFSIKDPTVAVAGSLTNVLSRRVSRLIVDDLLTDKIAFSDAESLRLERWYYNDVQPILLADGQEIITGTRYRAGDFYDKLIEKSNYDDSLYKVFIGDAIVDEFREKVLWPERWPWKALQRQRAKMGVVRFNRNYRNIIVSDEDAIFPMIWFEGGLDKKTGAYYVGCYEDTWKLGQPPRAMEMKNWLRTCTIGIDPAIGDTESSKYFSAVVLGLTYSNRLVVLEVLRDRISFPAQKRAILELNAEYSPRYVVVESNAYQKALYEGLFEESAKINVVPFYSTTNVKTKPDIGVPSMDVYFEVGRMRIPRGDERSIQMTDVLIQELHQWGKAATSDCAMALWFAFERMRPEIERSRVLPASKNVIFGDRMRYERQMVQGVSGHLIPRRARDEIRQDVMKSPLPKLIPMFHRRKRIPQEVL